VKSVASEVQAQHESRDVALTIPARPDYLVLARLALSAVCRLTPLSPDEISDLKQAISVAPIYSVDDSRPRVDVGRVSFSFRLLDDRLTMELGGPPAHVPEVEQELSRAIIDATVDECDFGPERTRLVKYLASSSE
jgi:serine/threonine-protein kinase RsbW